MKNVSWVALPGFAGNVRLLVAKRPKDFWLLGLSLLLVTDATAVSRFPTLLLAMGGADLFAVQFSTSIGASMNRNVAFLAGAQGSAGAGNSGASQVISLPVPGYHVASDHQLVVSVYQGVAGDAVSNVFMLIGED